jgi:diguanylate cyclase (GGDEF)-like protein
MFEQMQKRLLGGFWPTTLVAFSLGSLGYAFYPPERWLSLGLLAYLALIFGIFLCYWWSKSQPVLAIGVVLCWTMVGMSLFSHFPAFIAITQMTGPVPIFFAVMPTTTLALLWSWRGGALASGLALLLLAPHDNTWQFFFSTLAVLSFSSIGVLLHYTIAELKIAYDKLEQAATTDPLTRLGNRRALREDFAARQHVMLTLWDLNGLKKINDQQGHEAGDAYLLSFAGCLRENLPQSSRIYRIGGDEFVGLHDGKTPGEQLIAGVHRHFAQVAVGVVVLEGQVLDDALHRADALMYQHKRSFGHTR